ncbi:hypothetical protein IWZ01DRAFT_549923 [Phyllosticta capitalensis]
MNPTSKRPASITYEEMWSEAIPEYYTTAGYVNHESFNQDHERIKRQIDESLGSPKSSEGHGGIFWALASASVKIGGQAASLAFPPAAVIGTAVSLLVDAGQKSHDIVSNMEALQDKARFFFEELARREQNEKDGFPHEPHLKEIDLRLLRSYLKLCGLIEKYAKQADRTEKEKTESRGEDKNVGLHGNQIKSKEGRPRKRDYLFAHFSSTVKTRKVDEPSKESHQWKLFFKLLVGDNEIEGELKKIATHTERFDQARSGGTHINTAKIVKEMETKKRKEHLEKCLQTVKDGLNIQDEHDTSWVAKHQRLANNEIEGMGDWIIDYPAVKDWSNFSIPATNPVLKMEAPKTHGKTYLCHRVISHLRQLEPLPESDAKKGALDDPNEQPKVEHKSTRLAYYYFGKHGSEEEEKPSLRSAIISIVWQLVQKDMGYRESVAKACERERKGLLEESNLWDLLKRRKNSNFLIVLDGLDHARKNSTRLTDFIQDITRDEKIQCRILLSGSPLSLESIKDFGHTISLNHVKHVEGDVELFVKDILSDGNELMETPDSHQATNGPDSPEAISIKLLAMLRGVRNYDFINFLLKKMTRDWWSVEDVEALANELIEGGDFALVDRQIRHLSPTLSPRETADLNELIPWFVLPNTAWPTLKRIGEILAICHPGSRPRVQAYITEKFNTLLRVDNQSVSSESLGGFYRAQFKITDEQSVSDFEHRKKLNMDGNDQSAWGNEAIKQNVRDSLSNVPEGAALFEEFEKFLQERDKVRTGKIYFDPVDGHIKIITACLKAAFQQEGDFESLLEYSARWLPWHLSEIHPDILSTSQISAMADNMSLLRRFFTESAILRRWFKVKWINQLNQAWFPEQSKPDCVLRWFHDARLGKDPDAHEFREKIRNASDDAELLEGASKLAASEWTAAKLNGFLYRNSNARGSLIRWITSYLIKSRNNDEDENQLAFPPSVESILLAERWTRKLLHDDMEHSRYQVHMLDTFCQLGHFEQAMERLKKICANHEPTTGRAVAASSYLLRMAPDIESGYERALDIIEPLFERLQRLPDSSRDSEHNPFKHHGEWGWMIRLLGKFYYKAGRLSGAINCYKNHIELHPEAPLEFMRKMVAWMQMANQHDDLIHKVQSLEPEKLIALFGKGENSLSSHLAVTAAKFPDSGLTETCRAALEAHGEQDFASAHLKLCYGQILAWKAFSIDGHKAAMKEWVSILQYLGTLNPALSSDEKSRWLLEQTARSLGCAYVRAARAENQTNISEADRKLYFPFYDLRLDQLDPAIGRGTFVLARFYQSNGHKNLAANVLKPKLELVKLLLTDDDEENDHLGYLILADLLDCLDKDREAVSAWKLLYGYRPGDDENRKNTGMGSYMCDGFCGAEWQGTLSEDIYICKDCVEVSFDRRCFEKLQQGTLGFNECDKDHNFLRVPKWDAESASELKRNVPDTKGWTEDVLERLGVELDDMCTPKNDETDRDASEQGGVQ